MHCFPPEICEQIYSFACTDDGTTGRSLSLVSKYIRDTSAPYKLQSIAIRGADRTASFLSVLEKSPPHLRRVVYFLIANDSIDGWYTVDEELPESSSSIIRTTRAVTNLLPGVKRYRELKKLKERGHRATRCMNNNRWRDERIFSAFINILNIISTSLSTLTVDFASRWRLMTPQFPIHSPILLSALTSLTINYYALYHAELYGSPLAPMPSLSYLDLAGFRTPSHPLHLYEHITRLAPFLTHLRLPVRMAGDLWQGLGIRQDQHRSNDYATNQRNRLPSTLQRVYIQLSPQPEFRCCGSWEMHTAKRFIAEQDERIVVLNKADNELHIEELVGRSRFPAIETMEI